MPMLLFLFFFYPYMSFAPRGLLISVTFSARLTQNDSVTCLYLSQLSFFGDCSPTSVKMAHKAFCHPLKIGYLR